MELPQALEIAVRTDPGRVRSDNEDAVFGSADQGLAILADGMGGYNAGEVASGMAATLLSSHFDRFLRHPGDCRPEAFDAATGQRVAHRLMEEEVAAANAAIYNTAQGEPQFAGMGTTLVMAWFYDNQMTVAHIGDSRLYRLRDGDFRPLTRDHSFLQEQLDSGMITAEEARHSQNKNLLTRALGIEPEVVSEIHDYEVEPGDIYLLCSDGLNDMVGDEELGGTIHALAANLELAADELIRMANDNGGRDNVSVILVKVRGDFAVPRGWWQKLLARLK